MKREGTEMEQEDVCEDSYDVSSYREESKGDTIEVDKQRLLGFWEVTCVISAVYSAGGAIMVPW